MGLCVALVLGTDIIQWDQDMSENWGHSVAYVGYLPCLPPGLLPTPPPALCPGASWEHGTEGSHPSLSDLGGLQSVAPEMTGH